MAIHFDKKRPVFGWIASLAGLGAAALWWVTPIASTTRNDLPDVQGNGIQWRVAPPASALQVQEHAMASATPQVLGLRSKAAEVMAWSRSGDPRDAYKAYLVLQECNKAQRDDSRRSQAEARSQAICGDITPGQLTEEPSLLDRAAVAGVRGALWSYLAGGADGSGTIPLGTPDDMRDPTVAQYFAHALQYQQAAADKGDPVAMMGVSFYAENAEHDLVKALAYWVAQEQLGSGGAPSVAPMSAIVASLSSRVPADDVRVALQRGHALAAQALTEPCDGCGEQPAIPIASRDIALKVREQLSKAPAEWIAQNTFVPSDTITVCVAQACQAAAYQATGLWITEPASAPKVGD